MSVNKYMHPRNIYKTPPNFKDLAIKYPEFRKFTKQELSGKVSINFKDPAALRALTTTLLLKDFNLTVEIPLNRLVPTLPLRVNYLLWIEDLLQTSNLGVTSEVHGVDIGTGASCIYPLLLAKTNGWRMLATDVDEESVECAKQNVLRNYLGHLIEVKEVERGVILMGVLEEYKTYDFTMCNPPFFASEKELIASGNRSMNRRAPSNSLTGTLGELVVDGGEAAFIRTMVRESAHLGKRVRLFTTMVGHKSNVMLLKREMAAVGACSVGSYELCQGRTTRWVLAWTFDGDVKTTADCLVANRRSMSKPPFRYLLPRKEDCEYTVEAFSASVKEILHLLEMECIEINKSKNMLIYEITAWKNTWSKQRRKRRATQLRNRKYFQGMTVKLNEDDETLNTCVTEGGKQFEKFNSAGFSESEYSKRPRMESNSFFQSSCQCIDGDKCVSSQAMKCDGGKGVPLLKASLVIHRISSEIFLELASLEGLNGRDSLHQVLQYFKNYMKK